MSIETQLAQASKTRVERRDPQSIITRWTRRSFARSRPTSAWDTYFRDDRISPTFMA